MKNEALAMHYGAVRTLLLEGVRVALIGGKDDVRAWALEVLEEIDHRGLPLSPVCDGAEICAEPAESTLPAPVIVKPVVVEMPMPDEAAKSAAALAVVETPAPKKRAQWSPEARAAAAERLRVMNARKAAERAQKNGHVAGLIPEPIPPPSVAGDPGAAALAVMRAVPDRPAKAVPPDGMVTTADRWRGCREAIVAHLAASHAYTQRFEGELMADFRLTRSGVMQIRDEVMAERNSDGKRRAACSECGSTFVLNGRATSGLCGACRRIADEAERLATQFVGAAAAEGGGGC